MVNESEIAVISVIIPAYNAGKTIKRCLDSLLCQTYPAVEIVVVNDGSTDNTEAICREYQKNPKIVLIRKQNGGVSSARNVGLDRATGKFIMFVDSDDWVEPDYCETFLHYFKEDSLVFANPQVCRADDKAQVAHYTRSEAMKLRGCGIESPCSKLFDTAVIRKNNLRFPEKIALGEDFVFVLSYIACIQGELIRLSNSMYHYESTENETLSRKVPTLDQTMSFCQSLELQMKKIGIEDNRSRFILDRSIMLDLEKLILSKVRSSHKGDYNKYCDIKSIMSSTVYKKTCAAGVGSTNYIYEQLYKRRMAFFLTLYYALIGG